MNKNVIAIVVLITIVFVSIFSIKSCKESIITTTVVKKIDIDKKSDHVYYFLPKTIFEIHYSCKKDIESIEIKQHFITDYSQIFDINIENYNFSFNSNGYTIKLYDNSTLEKVELNSVSNTADNIKFAVNAGTSIIKILPNLSPKPSTANNNNNTHGNTKKDTSFIHFFEPEIISKSFKTDYYSIDFVNTNITNVQVLKPDSIIYQGIISRVPMNLLMKIHTSVGIDSVFSVTVPQFGIYQYNFIPISKTKDVKTILEFNKDGSLKSKSIAHSNKLTTKITQAELDELVKRINDALDSIKR